MSMRYRGDLAICMHDWTTGRAPTCRNESIRSGCSTIESENATCHILAQNAIDGIY